MCPTLQQKHAELANWKKIKTLYMYIEHLTTGCRAEGVSPVKVIVCRGLSKTRNRIKTVQAVPVPIFTKNSNYGDYFLLRKPIRPRGKTVRFCASWLDLPIYIFHWNYMHKLCNFKVMYIQCDHLLYMIIIYVLVLNIIICIIMGQITGINPMFCWDIRHPITHTCWMTVYVLKTTPKSKQQLRCPWIKYM